MIYCMNKTAEEITKSPFPDKMTFREMLTNLFNTDFLTEEELRTICDAGEMYANGCLSQHKAQSFAMKWVKASERLPNEAHVGEEIVYELLNHVYCAHAWHNTPDEISLFKNAVLRWLDEGD